MGRWRNLSALFAVCSRRAYARRLRARSPLLDDLVDPPHHASEDAFEFAPQPALTMRSRVAVGGSPRPERAMSGSNRRSSTRPASSGLRADVHELRVAIERPRVEVDRAEADDVVGDDRPSRGRRCPGSSQISTPAADQVGVSMPHGPPSPGRCSTLSETTTRTFTPRPAAARIRSIMSRSVRYAFITSRRSRAPGRSARGSPASRQ